MANIQSHVTQWTHNRALVGHIPAKYPDWLVTVAFYTALQAIDALLAYDNVPVYSHDARNGTLKHTNRYEFIWKHYNPLYDLSRNPALPVDDLRACLENVNRIIDQRRVIVVGLI